MVPATLGACCCSWGGCDGQGGHLRHYGTPYRAPHTIRKVIVGGVVIRFIALQQQRGRGDLSACLRREGVSHVDHRGDEPMFLTPGGLPAPACLVAGR